jgi:hypothetical protein
MRRATSVAILLSTACATVPTATAPAAATPDQRTRLDRIAAKVQGVS